MSRYRDDRTIFVFVIIMYLSSKNKKKNDIFSFQCLLKRDKICVCCICMCLCMFNVKTIPLLTHGQIIQKTVSPDTSFYHPTDNVLFVSEF